MKPLRLYLLVELHNGISPEEAALDMVRLANVLHCAIKADFNGTPMLAWPGDEAPEIVRLFEKTRGGPMRGG